MSVETMLASAAVADSRAPVVFVGRHPRYSAMAHGDEAMDDKKNLQALSELEPELGSAVSCVLLYTEREVRRQRLLTRAAMAASDAERDVREGQLRESDEEWLQSVVERYERLPVDARVDSTSVKQAVLRLLSMLDIGSSLLKRFM
eukprot:TRINITY_DN3168_c0_g1_i1.p1 TRINITY_DN3168_c0_g1~~TRINITY_DN3168_c0_g1_i1.p1  ORF type:complete len:146 (-),score=27.71 TRINITY_DN3168_c0_g1_i1:9-446(-)